MDKLPSSSLNIPSSGHTDLLCHFCSVLVSSVVNLLVIVHPNLSQAHLVPSDDFRSLGEGVRALVAENVTHHRTRDDLQLPSALPHLSVCYRPQSLQHHCVLSTHYRSCREKTNPEGHLNIFSTPDLHFVVIGSNVFEVRLQDGEETSGEGWRPNGRADGFDLNGLMI